MKLYAETNPYKIKLLFIENNSPQYYDEVVLLDEDKKGNVYLAEVTEINLALSGVFVNFKNNQSGFLSFYSIHPFYFNLNSEEKEALMKKLSKEQKGPRESLYYKKYLSQLNNIIKVGQKMIVQIIRKSQGKKGAMLSNFISLGVEFSYLPNALQNEIVFGDITHTIKSQVKEIFLKWKAKGFFLLSKTPYDPLFLSKLEKMIEFWHSLTPQIHNEQIGLIYKEETEIISNYLLEKTSKVFYSGDFNMEEFPARRGFNIETTKVDNSFKPWKKVIDSIWNNQIFLKSGGYLFITYCEGGTFIDVNIGSNRKHSSFAINMEATIIICQQIKVRNISGIIFIDFLDMEAHWEQITRQIEVLLTGKNKMQIITINSVGNAIIYRQNLGGFQCANYFEKKQKWTVERTAEDMFSKIYNKAGLLKISNDLLQFSKNRSLIPGKIKIQPITGEKKWQFVEDLET